VTERRAGMFRVSVRLFEILLRLPEGNKIVSIDDSRLHKDGTVEVIAEGPSFPPIMEGAYPAPCLVYTDETVAACGCKSVTVKVQPL
jgi:hypothetical protein